MALSKEEVFLCLIDDDASDSRLGSWREARGHILTSRREAERRPNRRGSEREVIRRGCL